MTDSPLRNFSLLAWPAYLTALALVFFPVSDLASTVWPPNFGGVAWRFAAIGLFSGGLVTPLLGLALAVTTAVLLEHRLVAYLLTACSVLFALALVPAMPIFALDALQMTTQVQPDMRDRFLATWGLALVKLAVLALAAIAMAIAAFRATRMRAAEARGSSPDRARAAERRREQGASTAPSLASVGTAEGASRAKPAALPSTPITKS